ncbi:VWA domain-containing protein [Gordonia amarae]|uniref:substrate-binding and VWA domain-containing protein n=1 Tax=Gordonia amarae TaxID=36821 RepID=UPI001AF4E50B|nr:substrate-binding and VWA domain-containing protein [Gordonia amarae]QHN30028.1 VWA domain-containing protein [Gordonia amarae]
MVRHGGDRRRGGSHGEGGRGGATIRVATAVALVAILAGGVVLWRDVADGCGGNRTGIAVAADPTIATTLRSVAEKASDTSCFDYSVEAVEGGRIPALLTGGKDIPDLWVADSQHRARRVLAQVRLGSGAVVGSLATTPAVVASTQTVSEDSWVDVMNLPDLNIGNPASSSLADAPIIGALGAPGADKLNKRTLMLAMAEMASRRNDAGATEDSEQGRLKLADTSTVHVVTSEQQYLEFLRGHAGTRLQATTPATGTVLIDYPLVNTSKAHRDRTAEAAAALVRTAGSGAGQKILGAAGFRNPDGTGVGEPVKALTVDATKLDKALDQWFELNLPTRTIMAIDTSGSMQSPAGNSTRAALLTDAVVGAFALIPRNGVVGMWIFGIDKGGIGTDWNELVPSRRLDEKVGDVMQRDMLITGVRKAMTTQLGGDTGLYDTILAGYKKALADYDPNYSNTFTVLTDGRNEDSRSISLDDLVKQLKALTDPGRPVRIVAMGISEDADAESLTKITDVTGGATFVATDPGKIKTIFDDAARTRLMNAS